VGIKIYGHMIIYMGIFTHIFGLSTYLKHNYKMMKLFTDIKLYVYLAGLATDNSYGF
jgi:hypothetical protein